MKQALRLMVLFALPTTLAGLCLISYSKGCDTQRRLQDLRARGDTLENTCTSLRERLREERALGEKATTLDRLRSMPAETERELQATIDTLLKAREKNPPRPHLPHYPQPAKGLYFLELMDDPVYARLVRIPLERGHRNQLDPLLRDLSADKRSQLYTLLAERDLVKDHLDAAFAKKGQTPDKPTQWKARAEEEQRIDREINETLGEEMAQRVAELRAKNVLLGNMDAAKKVDKITNRLSYSTSPLTHEQQSRLEAMTRDWYHEQLTRRGPKESIAKTEEDYLRRSTQILSESQLTALRELQTEARTAEWLQGRAAR